MPVALAHGAALIALTIDEVGMAKTAERKVEIAKRIRDLCCEEHGLDPELLIFDCLTFTLTTGDEEWRPSAVETIAGIRAIKAEIPHVKTSLGVSNVSFGVSPGARAVLNSVFLHHCVEAGLDLAMVNPNHITPYSEISDDERELADDLVFNRREDALERFIAHFESKGEEEAQSAADPTEGMEPEQALHFHILRRRKEGVEAWIDASVEKIGAVPTLNDVLLPAMKEVGDKFGAGELILPFVLQSAEVMKRAVAQLEKYLDKIEGYTKGTVVLATVFGDVHDIGKSLVNTILTNNGYTVIDLGKQVPIQTIVDAAEEHDATAIGLSALLVSTSKQMPACIQELHAKRPRVPGADRRRGDQPRVRLPRAVSRRQGVRGGVRAGRVLLQGRLRGARRDGPADRRGRPRRARGEAPRGRDASSAQRARSPPRISTSPTTPCARPRAPTCPCPTPPFWGVQGDPGRPRRGLPPPRHARAVQAALGRPRRQRRGVADAAARGLPPAPGADVARADLPAPARAARLLPLLLARQRHRRARPRGPHDASSRASSARASRRATASAWPTSSAPRSTASRRRSST